MLLTVVVTPPSKESTKTLQSSSEMGAQICACKLLIALGSVTKLCIIKSIDRVQLPAEVRIAPGSEILKA